MRRLRRQPERILAGTELIVIGRQFPMSASRVVSSVLGMRVVRLSLRGLGTLLSLIIWFMSRATFSPFGSQWSNAVGGMPSGPGAESFLILFCKALLVHQIFSKDLLAHQLAHQIG